MKVGDYVRTNKGNIAKIIKITPLTVICDGIVYPSARYGFDKQLRKENLKRLAIKTNKNIIDLIEVGDYVNGYKVIDIAQAPKKAIYTESNSAPLIPITNENIKSILTKEQFEAIKYEIK